MTAVYITVNHYDKKTPIASRPVCAGCTPSSVDGRSELTLPPERAEYQIVGASDTLALCRNCAIHSIKSLAARFMMFDPSATRDLMDFFAAAAKKSPAAAAKKKRTKNVIDVVEQRLLEGKKRSP
jgi:hypothetical protein